MTPMYEIQPVVDTGNGHKTVIGSVSLTLATYNAGRARGIVHTPEWQAAMQQLQEQFNEQWETP